MLSAREVPSYGSLYIPFFMQILPSFPNSSFYSVMESSKLAGVNMSDDRQPQLTGQTIAIVSLAVVFVTLRLAARWNRGANLGVDDYLMLLAIVRFSGA